MAIWWAIAGPVSDRRRVSRGLRGSDAVPYQLAYERERAGFSMWLTTARVSNELSA